MRFTRSILIAFGTSAFVVIAAVGFSGCGKDKDKKISAEETKEWCSKHVAECQKWADEHPSENSGSTSQ